MTWIASLAIGLLTAVFACITSGFAAAACEEWYPSSGRDGGAGYGVIAIALLGGILGLVAGLVIARIVAAGPSPGFLKGLAFSFSLVVAVCGGVTLIAWGLADIPPRLDGSQIRLEVEVRLPDSDPDPSRQTAKDGYILFASSNPWSRRIRKDTRGELDFAGARQLDGRWIVPGSVRIFTTRGIRSLIVIRGPAGVGFELPLPRQPGHEYEQWSAWLPRLRAGAPWPSNEVSYRFRIRKPNPRPPQV